MAGKHTNIGAKRAREARAELGLAPTEPVGCLLTAVEYRLEIPVAIAAMPEAIAGCCWRDGDRVLLWVNGTQPAVRQRFTLAHELGHVRCGHDSQVPEETFETLAGKVTDAREVQANAFAAELLAPAAGVRAMVGEPPLIEDIVRIAARYGVSTLAALFRLSTLGIPHDHDALRQAIEDGSAAVAWDRLRPDPVDDLIARLDRQDLPRLSPSLGR